MKKITINFIETIMSFKTFAIMAFLMCSGGLFAQAITDVFPIRVTTNSEITLIGSNFSETTTVAVNGVSIDNITFVSSTEMSFEVAEDENQTTNVYNKYPEIVKDMEVSLSKYKSLKNKKEK